MATTKAYSAQLIASYLLAVQFAKARGTIDEPVYASLIAELQSLPEKIARILEDKERLQWFAAKYSGARASSSSAAVWTTPSRWKAA